MPYYVGEDMPVWEQHYADEDKDPGALPPTAFAYVEPWVSKTRVTPIPSGPVAVPAVPPNPYDRQRAAQSAGPVAAGTPAPKQGWLSRMFGVGRQPPAPQPSQTRPHPPVQISAEDFSDYFLKSEAARSAAAMNSIVALCDSCRQLGIARLSGSYDGGNDESFTHFTAIELSDGTRLDGKAAERKAIGIDLWEAIDLAATAIMGRYDAGPFELYGALTIDVEKSQIIDENDRTAVFDSANPDRR